MKNFFSHLVEKEYYSRQNTAGDFLSQRSGMHLNEYSCYLHDVYFILNPVRKKCCEANITLPVNSL